MGERPLTPLDHVLDRDDESENEKVFERRIQSLSQLLASQTPNERSYVGRTRKARISTTKGRNRIHLPSIPPVTDRLVCQSTGGF